MVGLRVGTIRQRDRLVPQDQFWFRSSRDWLAGLASLQKQDKQPVFDPKAPFHFRPSR